MWKILILLRQQEKKEFLKGFVLRVLYTFMFLSRFRCLSQSSLKINSDYTGDDFQQ